MCHVVYLVLSRLTVVSALLYSVHVLQGLVVHITLSLSESAPH